MSRRPCPGCFPRFQENQLAHMESGGCMEIKDEYCEYVSECAVQDAEAAVEMTDIHPATPEPDEASRVPSPSSEANEKECCICYENIGQVNNCVTPCGHEFCFRCLAMAMNKNNSCPCCRAKLIDIPDDDEDEEITEYDEDEDEDEEEDDEDVQEAPVEDLVNRLEKNGITMTDVVSLLLDRYSKTDPKYTNEYISKMVEKFDNIQTETDNEYSEQLLFAKEDLRATG